MANEQWHLDKRVPIALILAIFVQSAGAVWWASGMNERMDQVERRLGGFAERSQKADEAIADQARDIAVLVEQIEGTNRTLDRLHAQMEATNSLLRQILMPRPQDGRGNQ